MPLVPVVIKRSYEGERSMDLFSRLLDERIIFLGEEINDDVANVVISQLLYLQSEDPKKDITMYINSPGGSVVSMWAMIDTMNLISCDVSTVCVGLAASAASAMLVSGTKGKRYMLPHARVMIHQPMGGARGQATDIKIVADEILKTREEMYQYMVEKTGQPYERISTDMERDFYMDAKQSLEYGVIDKIIGLDDLETDVKTTSIKPKKK
ncbi:MAG: ATP-dependent Clp endopeptidase proteolytic subunit ClpP [Patescibacteria group bacterium]